MADEQKNPGNPGFYRADGVELRDYLEGQIKALRELMDMRLALMEKATGTATGTLESRLAGMNEFRDALKDQASRLVPEAKCELQVKSFREQIDELKKFRNQLEGKASTESVNRANLFAAVGILLGLVGLALNIMRG